MLYTFNDNYSVMAETQGCYTITELELEQGMYSATPEFCREHGGPITNKLLDLVPQSYLDEATSMGLWPNIDVRVHRLYPNSYPAFPGWHCDAQFRETYFGQPKLEQTELSNHLICTVSSEEEGVSNTEFIAEKLGMTIPNYDPEDGESFWKKVDEQMRTLDDVKTWIMPDGALTRFDCWTLHRAMPAMKRGWRLFFRVAMWYRPNLDNGKLSRQEVIYMNTNKATGW